MPREILVDWTLASGSGKVSVFMFDPTPTIAAQRTALQTWLTAVKAHLDNSASYVIRTDGREMDDTTGALTGSWSETSAKTGTGGGTLEPVADATQMLVRWKTPTIVNGRFLQGRTFIPGLAASNEAGGNLASATSTSVQTANNALIASVSGLGVWHRPVSGSGGLFDLATTSNVWSELAVLRRRRG